MNNKLLIGLLVAVLAGGGIFFATNSSDDGDNNNNSSSETTTTTTDAVTNNEGANLADNPLGIDLATTQGPYIITVTNRTADGTESVAVISADGDGNVATEVQDGGQANSIIVFEGSTYTQNPDDGSWIKFPAGSPNAISAEDANTGLNQEDIDELNDSEIVDKGTGPCAAGTCRIFEVTDSSDETGTIKVDEANRRISES